MAGKIEVTPLTDPRKSRGFMRLPEVLNQGDPHWVHPLRMSVSKLLNRSKYPFFKFGDAAFYLATMDGEPVGRIAAIENRLHNETYNDTTGFFGFFECEDDPRVARELFRHAAKWLKQRNLTTVRGPLNYSMNDECPGILYDGDEGIPMLLMSHNPRYYLRLLESCGLSKAIDLYAYLVTRETVAAGRFERMMKAVRRRAPALDLRPVRMDSGFKQDIRTMLDTFNTAWKDNWGFVPVTDAEVETIAADLKPIVRPELTAVAEIDGKPAGMSVCVPNVNEILHQMGDGRLFPTGWYKLLTGLKGIKGIRTMLMGVVHDYRGRGVDALMIEHVMRNAWDAGIETCELSWVLENNEPMVSLADKAGGRLYRKYRLLEANVDDLLQA
jgi:GNAT superfamily N-acetyltransferase